jgi:predicted DNA-binding transcriptional regulator AlpA
MFFDKLVWSLNTNWGFSVTGTVQTVEVVVLPDGRMDPKNASTYCGLSVKTLAMKRCNGTGPKFVKLGRVFYFREDLDAWLQGNRVVSTAQAQQTATE